MKNSLLILLFLSLGLSAQDKVSISIFQDARLFITGDERGNSAGTANILTRFNMQGNQKKHGYMVVSLEGEYADLVGYKYYRYSANLGYTFNNLVKNFEFNLSGGWGWINRGLTSHSGAISGALQYKLTDWVKIGVLGQLTDRTDIEVKRFSGFFGVEISLK